MSVRVNFIIRAVATVTGDITIGYAMASACVWAIQSAALGLFLSFVLWLLAIIASLALSQHVVHPAVTVLLSDRKLDQSIALAADAARAGSEAAKQLWAYLRPAAA